MSKFNWGPTFIRLNQELLDGYANCKDGKEVVVFQNQYLDQLGKNYYNFIINIYIYIFNY